ncbi:MAG: tannase/feruloyl esterase family alpha/beta hydrolase [Gammaproteobacteria bacterium]|nr:tannase/feruloyl esterase family alpha/beta hydrolase [Gammaproteobacteria bacterium]
MQRPPLIGRIALAIGCAAALACGAAQAAPSREAAAGGMPRKGCAALAAVPLARSVGAPVSITRAAEADLDGARYCVVAGTIAPRIRFEARLPVAGWSGRYLQTGCGGLCGVLQIAVEHGESCAPVRDHQVVLASTDMGHEGMGGDWAARDPAARADFGYRGVHLTAVAVKALIRAYYGRAPRYAYFSGCSDGGREALIEAQRFPDDFDGIAAGAPALNFTVQNSFYHAWNALSNMDAHDRPILTGAALPRLHAAVVAACDALDGTRDGVIEDPRRCRFDPAALACPPGEARNDCLSAAQVETVRRIYRGASDAQGRRLVMGGPMPGSELAWEGVYVPRTANDPIPSRLFVEDSVPNLYYERPLPRGWTVRQLGFDAATLHSFRLRGLYDATDPDLSAFRAHGGKLLMWHGWSDPHISPANSIGYFEALRRWPANGPIEDFARLFLLPGVYHCGGGEGPATFEILEPLMQWVEHGRAPESLMLHGAATSRPVYPYPDSARRSAAGTRERLRGNFESNVEDWLGADFFRPGYEIRCDSGLPSRCAAGSPQR